MVRELLPWYVNETIVGKDEELVLKHLVDCEACQTERDQLYELSLLVKEDEAMPASVEDTGASFRRTWQRIEIAERNRASVREIEQPASSANRWIPFGLAASVLLLVGLVGVNNTSFTEPPAYQTLTSGSDPIGEMRRMELGFEQPIPAVTLRQALLETRSNIVSGPDNQGVYVVEVRLDKSVDEARYLERLQQIEGVRHARFTAD